MLRNLARFALGATLVSAVAACGSSTATTGSPTPSPVSGTATASGSTALQPLVSAAKDEFEAANPGATITVGVGGSFQGLSQAATTAADIGDSDVPAGAANPPLANASQLVDHQVAVVPFVIIASPAVKVTSLTQKQAQDLISGTVTDWKDVGNPTSLKVHVYLRPKTSGTRYTFAHVVLGSVSETATPQAIVPDTNTVIQNVSQDTAGGISYVALGSVKATSGVTKLQYNGVDATPANVINGTYKIWSHEHMYTCTCDTSAGATVARAFISYILSDKFQHGEAITKLGFIAVSQVKGTSPADS
jgi:phosphate transport system substrate-binding protein